MDNLYDMTAVQLRHEIQVKNIRIEELTKAYLNRIEKYDGLDGLNTIAELNPYALQQARAMDSQEQARALPLLGLSVLVKDNIDVAGLHTTAGSLALVDNIAREDAPVIANLKRNGAIILGKTNMTEFANHTTKGMPEGYSSRGGQVKNAYNCTNSPGGSSSGSAVAVSAGFCSAAIGTDTAFSVVGCATENGVVGLKPEHGYLSDKGIIPISHTLDSVGLLTHNFSDALMLYSAMRNKPLKAIAEASPKKLRVGVNIFNRDQVSDAQLARYEVLFKALREAGASLSQVSHKGSPYLKDIMDSEFKKDLEGYLCASTCKIKTLEELVRFYEAHSEKMMKYGITSLRRNLNKADDYIYMKALEERKRLRDYMLEELRQYDACVMTGPTSIMHFIGLPSVALGLCMADDNTPRGIILYGADEERLFSAALTMEKYCIGVIPPSL